MEWKEKNKNKGNAQHQIALLRPFLQHRHKRHGKHDVSDIIDAEFLFERRPVQRLGLRQIHAALDAGVQEHAVDVRVLACHPGTRISISVLPPLSLLHVSSHFESRERKDSMTYLFTQASIPSTLPKSKAYDCGGTGT